jgi:uncharacterized repeat protein (TIGR03803 family)
MTNFPRPAVYGVLTCLLAFTVSMPPAHAQTLTDIHDFNCSTEGCEPLEPQVLAQGRDGNLYGTTYEGGLSGCGFNTCGTVFMIVPSTGVLTTLFTFDGGANGGQPQGGLTLGLDGNFYGTTLSGGANKVGTIFQITPSGTLKVLHSFATTNDGLEPWASPILGNDGNLYGTTPQSNPNSYGLAYKITPSGTYKILNAKLGGYAYAGLTLGMDGAFYATTQQGGTNKQGSLYRLTTAGAELVKYSFAQATGDEPYDGVAQDINGNFYVTAPAGGAHNAGSALKVPPKGAATDLHDFNAEVGDGTLPYVSMVLGSDGNLYGVASGGGAHSDGTVFEITSAGAYSTLSSFDGTHGNDPTTTPMQHTSGVIYGMTRGGGAHNFGVIYSFANGQPPFIAPLTWVDPAGKTIEILGYGFDGTTTVKFGSGSSTTVKVTSSTYLTAVVPASGTTGLITATTGATTLQSKLPFTVKPVVSSFSPTSGPVGTQVTITGSGLVGATKVTFGGKAATTYTVDPSGTFITATVPTGAVTGKVSVTTKGGTASGPGTFTVT